MQRGATCHPASKMGRMKGPGFPPEIDRYCQEQVLNKPLSKESSGYTVVEVCLSPVLVDRIHKPHIIKAWV